jgi:nucleotide-binding universal stress UspA family protein
VRRFKSILFVADGSEGEKSVCARAANRASANGAKLTLFAALDAEAYQLADQEHRSAIEAINEIRLEERRKELETLRQEALSEHPELTVDVAVETGTMAVSVIRAVLVNGHDLVLKAAEGRPGRWKRLFGTGDQKLMRKCPCPVWIVKPSSEPHFRKILAAVDLNPTEPDTESLAERITALATSLATEEGSELHVVHVWRLAGETELRGRSIHTADVDSIVEGMEAAHQSELDRLLEPHPYTKRTVHLIKGRAGDVIPDLVEKIEADLVVIGTVGRAGVPGLLIGNTAEEILNAVDCSVLTLKPEGFETPIQV